MWEVLVVCSDCREEFALTVEELDQVEREVCSCGYSLVVVSVASFEAVHADE